MTTPTTNPMPAPVEAVVLGFRKYADFGGRATRAEFWWWALFYVIGGIVFGVIDSVVGWSSSPLETVFTLAILLPTLAVTARRLHDIGKTGWWQLGWYAINLIAWLVAGILYFIAAFFTYRTRDASGGWSFDTGDVDWANSGEIFAAYPASAIVFLAAIVITVAAIVWAIVWLVRRGESGENRFGPDPRT